MSILVLPIYLFLCSMAGYMQLWQVRRSVNPWIILARALLETLIFQSTCIMRENLSMTIFLYHIFVPNTFHSRFTVFLKVALRPIQSKWPTCWIFNLKIELCELINWILVYLGLSCDPSIFFREWTRLFDAVEFWNIRIGTKCT